MGAKSIVQAGASDGAPRAREPNPLHRVLVVDGEPRIRQLATQILSHSGFEVDAVVDGAAAWDALNDEIGYDLLITDNDLPTVTGVELLKKLRAARMILPVITAHEKLSAPEIPRIPWLQPAAALVKPFTGEQLLGTVKKVLREAESEAGSQLSSPRKSGKISPAGGAAGATRLGLTDSPRRILVVDDDSDLRLLYIDALARPGFFIDVAADGAAAWEALQANSYNLVITENDIPNLTGVELVKKLRSARMSLPVVMAAVRLPVHELARNPSLQLAATLAKPFALETLLSTVENVLLATDQPPKQIAPSARPGRPAAGR